MNNHAAIPAPDLALGPEWAALELVASGATRCTEGGSRFDDLVSSADFSMETFFLQSLRHDLLPRVARELCRPAFSRALPVSYKKELQTALVVNRHRVSIFSSAAVSLSRTFSELSVRCAVTKGVALEPSIYAGDGTRVMGDIDFMILPADRSRVAEAMERGGFRNGRFDWLQCKLIELDRRTIVTYKLNPDHLPHFYRMTADLVCPYICVDFANSLTWTDSPWQAPVELALEGVRPQPLMAAEGVVPTLALPFQFLFTILHLFREAWFAPAFETERDVTLSKFTDVARLWLQQREAITSGGFVELVNKYELTMPVAWVLQHLDRTVGTVTMRELGFLPVADSWLQSAQAPGGGRLVWEGTMRERLAMYRRRNIFHPSTQ